VRPRVFQDRTTGQWTVIGAAARNPFPTWAEAYAAAERWADSGRRSAIEANGDLVRAVSRAVALQQSMAPRRAGGRR
jgi:hypothetical protein